MLDLPNIAFVLVMVLGILLVAEHLKRKEHIRGEVARKFVHLMVGSFVACWPFFLSWHEIRLICLAFIVVVLIDRHLHLFKSVHSVRRKTVGDVLFPLGIAAVTFITQSPWIFAVAVLHLSLGDGFAAVVGNHYGKRYTYELFKQSKSVVGSLAFLVVSLVITAALILYMPVNLQEARYWVLLWMPLTATLLEGLSVFGIDNVTVPVFVALLLNSLQAIG